MINLTDHRIINLSKLKTCLSSWPKNKSNCFDYFQCTRTPYQNNMCSYSFVDLTSGDFLSYYGECEDAGKDTDADDDDVLDNGDFGQLVHLQFEVHHAGQDEGKKGTTHGSCTQPNTLTT